MTTRTRATSASRAAALLAASLLAAGLASTSPAAATTVTGHATRMATAPAAAVHTTAPPTLAAVGSGHLGTQGCTTAGTTATCALYARTGTVQLVGRTFPVWGWSGAATGNPTLPGPLLVVDQGSTVNLVVHNELAGPLSLAVPGVPAPDLTSGFDAATSTTGVAPGASRTFTLHASRPGTFVYEAGHTSDGARQVAMGLAGVLVVRPTDATTAYGSASSAFTDEAVVALSEVDPALNADPTGFDMRGFNPRYRLVNGKSFPETDVIPTDQGHRLLLRYADLGALPHAMSILGSDQVAVARDGHPLTYPQGEVVEPLTPGETADTVVSVPTGADSRLALVESGTHLDNDGMTTADPTQTAFGGMLTFLDTNAPPVSGDHVGPSVTHVTATPNPSDATTPMTITADLSDATTGGGAVSAAEVVVDDASTIGPGNGTAMTGAFGGPTVTGATAAIPVSVLSDPSFAAGRHVVYVRGRDSEGNWGTLGSVAVNVPKRGPLTTGGTLVPNPVNGTTAMKLTATGNDTGFGGQVTGAEYFLDPATNPDGTFVTDPTNGTGVPVAFVAGRTITSETATIPPASGLAEGPHHVFVHSKDTQGLWGPLLDVPFTVDIVGPVTIASAMSPSALNGVISDPSNPGFAKVTAIVQDSQNNSQVSSRVVQAVAFFDDAAAPTPTHKGMTLQATDGAFDSSVEGVYGLVPLSQVKTWATTQGDHKLYVYGQDAAGNWGATTMATFVVDTAKPVISSLSVAPTPGSSPATMTVTTNLSGVQTSDITVGEVWFGGTDPGVGRATKVTVTYTGTQATFTIPRAQLLLGSTTVNLRLQDKAGNWSVAASGTATVSATPVDTQTFDSTTFPPTGWARTGGTGVARSTTQPRLIGTAYVRATGSATPAYLTSPTAAPATVVANAQLVVRGDTLAVPAGKRVTVYQGYSGTAARFSVVATGSGAGLALTPVLAGQPTPTGTPITVGSTAMVTVRVTMDSTAGQLTLAVYSTTGALLGVEQLGNGTPAAGTSSIRVGLVDQSTGTRPSGRLSFDQLQRW